jgi:hypothetical protein
MGRKERTTAKPHFNGSSKCGCEVENENVSDDILLSKAYLNANLVIPARL